MSHTAYPLQWPDGWQRTKYRKNSDFRVSSFARVRDGVLKQIQMMGGKSAVLSTNIPLRLDGIPYANTRAPEDPGVAVYWYDAKAKQQRCIACDRWRKVEDNLRAVEKSLDAMRGLDRWGSSEVVERAFKGFAALPEPATGWRAVLGNCSTLIEANALYKKLAFEAHPDRGGSNEAMQRLNRAWHEAEKELRS